MSGRAVNPSNLDAYNKASKTSAVGKFMRTFSRTKTSQLVTAWDSIYFATVWNNYFMMINDATGAVDSATTGDAGLLILLDLAWEAYYSNANLKDLSATEEASWKRYFCVMLQICISLQVQYNFRCHLPAYTESDTVPGAADQIPYFTQSSFDIFVSSMKEFPVPKGIYEIIDIFCTWIVQLSQEYEKFTLRIPPAYLFPFNDLYDLANLEDLRGVLRVELGNFITHGKKFGLPTGAWRDPIAPRIKQVSDPDVIAFFNHAAFNMYDNTPGQERVSPNGGYLGANLTTDYTGVEFYFKDTPNESLIHLLAPWFGVYDATNNPYGGFIHALGAAAVEYKINFAKVAQHGTGMSTASIVDGVGGAILPLLKGYDDGKSATFQVFADGTNFTDAQVVDDYWKFAAHYNLFKGMNRGATETNNDIIVYIGRTIT